jgi:hypothetical protein
MLVRDPFSGLLHEVPEYGGYGFSESPFGDAPDLSEYDIGEVVYDGLGQPVGLFPLIPLIASALPAIASAAKGLIPAVASAIPKVSSLVSSLVPPGLGPGLAPAMPYAPAAPIAPPVDYGPSPAPAMPYAPAAPIAPPVDYGPSRGPATVVAPSGPSQIVIVRRFRRRRRPNVG